MSHTRSSSLSPPVLDRAAQRTITVTAPANLAGRFEWLNDTVVQWVPDQFWPAHAEISMMVGGVPRNFGTGATVLGWPASPRTPSP